MKKNLYIIAGCNGAGKTTASFTILPEILNCKEFVNSDNFLTLKNSIDEER
jgi:predicted ABC-type ATPase